MSEHKATIDWKQASPDFLTGQYSRDQAHEQCFIANSIKTEVAVKGAA